MHGQTAERQSLLDQIVRQFAFLDTVGARRTIDTVSDLTTVTFRLPSFFIEVEVDWREQAAFALVGKLQAGTLPSGYYVDQFGQRCRWHLSELLELAGRDDEVSVVRSPMQHSGEAAMDAQIEAYSKICARILDNIPAMLEHATPARATQTSGLKS